MEINITIKELKAVTKHYVNAKCNGDYNIRNIAENFRIEADTNNRLYVSTTTVKSRYVYCVTLSTGAVTVLQSGEMVLNAERVRNIANKLSNDKVVTLVYSHDFKGIKGHKFDFKLESPDPDDYPVPEYDRSYCQFTVDDFIKRLSKVAYAQDKTEGRAKTDARESLNGVALSIVDGTLYMVATDGNRMAINEKSMPDRENKTIIVPNTAVEQIKKYLDGPVTVTVYEQSAVFADSCNTIDTELIYGNYPDFFKVVPSSNRDDVLSIDNKQFIEAINLVKPLQNKKEKGIDLQMSPSKNLVLSTLNGKNEQATIEVACSYNGVEKLIKLNSDYLLETAKRLALKDVTIKFGTPTESVLFTDRDTKHVIMPLRN